MRNHYTGVISSSDRAVNLIVHVEAGSGRDAESAVHARAKLHDATKVYLLEFVVLGEAPMVAGGSGWLELI